MIWKRKQKPAPAKEMPKRITLSEQEFIDMVIDFETGKIDPEDILIFFAYIDENSLFDRYGYPWLMDFIERGIIVNGLVNPLKLKQYKASK